MESTRAPSNTNQNTMSKVEKLLALLAALEAAEGALPPSMEGHANNLQIFLGEVMDEAIPNFGDFCTLQRAAIHKLANNPALFGS